MIIDCDQCAMRGVACADCVVTALFDAGGAGVPAERDTGPPAVVDGPLRFDATERRALAVLAAAGLISPLRLESSASFATRREEEITQRRNMAG